MARYLVTGGAGFIGSNVADELLRQGETVRILDDFSTGKEENIKNLGKEVDIIEGDIKDFQTVKKAVKGVEYIIHEAALRSVPYSIEEPVAANETNVNGTLNILQAAREAGVKRVVYASSSSVYGDGEVFPQVETFPPRPISPYAVSKLAGEYYCRVFYQVYRLETVCLRYFNVFGPRQDPTSQYANVVPIFVMAALNNKTVEVHGDGRQSRDFTYISDTVEATLLSAKRPQVAGHVFNVACGESHSVLDLVREIGEIGGRPLKYSHTKAREGDPRCTLADITKARDLLGYKAKASFPEGLRKTWDWFKKRELDKRSKVRNISSETHPNPTLRDDRPR